MWRVFGSFLAMGAAGLAGLFVADAISLYPHDFRGNCICAGSMIAVVQVVVFTLGKKDK